MKKILAFLVLLTTLGCNPGDKTCLLYTSVHEDFMIGTSDLEIIGIDHLGNETLIMKNGNFVFTEK